MNSGHLKIYVRHSSSPSKGVTDLEQLSPICELFMFFIFERKILEV